MHQHNVMAPDFEGLVVSLRKILENQSLNNHHYFPVPQKVQQPVLTAVHQSEPTIQLR